MKIKKIVFFFFIFNVAFTQTKYYNFNIYEGKDYLFTMNQSSDLMLSTTRYIGEKANTQNFSKKEKIFYDMGLSLFTSLLGQPITHEEGHRSVLSELGIGSISKPFVNKNLVAKVTGVTDATLINLRDTNFPNYIRLHAAGLESDYVYLKKTDNLLNFNEETLDVLYTDYLLRQLGTSFYYLSNFIQSKSGIKELDDPELQRDIVGHDIFGMIRHLHRPSMNFKRYTEWDDLTTEEKSYGKRMGFLSLLNYANPNIWKKSAFNFSKNVKGNFSLNYSLAPFGDFVEQNVYLNINNKWKINPYVREYFNKSNTFFAGGLSLHNYVFNENILLNGSIDFWQQPKELNFTTNQSDFGFGIKTEVAYRLLDVKTNKVFFNLGLNYKTKGFIPAMPSLENDFRINFGLIIATKNQ